MVRLKARRAPAPTKRQVAVTTAICNWYLHRYHGTQSDLGVPAMFMRRDVVGDFAVTPDEWRRGDARALFRLLVATTLFQRRQDQQVLRILRGMSPARVREVGSHRRLLNLVDDGDCSLMRTQEALIGSCDLTKDGGAGVCTRNPDVPCHLKAHTVWLKRYGHFGKVPSSAALMLREHHARDLVGLYDSIVAGHASARARSEAIEAALCSIWRVNEKIAAMFLSMLSNADLASVAPPWRGLDATYFVVIDSNTDLFLASIGYRGTGTYHARRQFLSSLAAEVDLSALKAGVSNFNPRLVQQAAYCFMSRVNRRAAAVDCWRGGTAVCERCPSTLRGRCPVVNVAEREEPLPVTLKPFAFAH